MQKVAMTFGQRQRMNELLAAAGKDNVTRKIENAGNSLAPWYVALKYRRELQGQNVELDAAQNEQLDFMQEKIDDWASDYDPPC